MLCMLSSTAMQYVVEFLKFTCGFALIVTVALIVILYTTSVFLGRYLCILWHDLFHFC